MKKIHILLFTLSFAVVIAQKRSIPIDTVVVSTSTAIVKNITFTYTASTGTQPVWNDKNEPIATLYYTYYERSNIKDKANRPIVFSFNGGPGSASVWMHIGYTGPKILNIDEEGYPIQPYGVKNNPNSILDIADIVYVNPVNTGYSRMIEDKEGKLPERDLFFGINADIKYLAEWMTTFVSRKNRWESPKYIIGESYGGTRVMGLANELQNNQWMYLNGVILVSPADYKLYNTSQPIYSSLNLPYYTATAWYHKALATELQNKDLLDLLPEAENFAINSLMPAIAKGGFISENEKNEIAKKVAYYSGLSETAVLQNNLEVPADFFWKDLLRDETGKTIGRLDSRYLGIDKRDTGDSPDYSPELTTWNHAFTPAINYYIREHLGFKTDTKYNMFGDVHPWDRQNDNTRDNLRQAMAKNPYLKVLIQSGYYDGATTYFGAKYTMWQIDPSGKMKDRFTFKGYKSGHMMYIRSEDLKSSCDDLRDFIINSLSKGKSAKY
ncbi:carboxypeptidase C (cathepsin A) [Mariniflexile fucanivorans]|uniref:Carboxypeptidase C (Cathepsin A) n=1 Tax=Mariniflexile fucanivorans TaxID=264023 RepID=A0A4R1RNY4_9FLAO|nr:carboxypeptidase [Mariniflexile fucanivorans]TCL68041.1 carboxypeptidase C (cathepsin A) [Mariniflexile fucanivorans]